MERRRCTRCCFYGLCPSGRVCDFYSPVGEEAEELDLLRESRQDRFSFYGLWDEYLRGEAVDDAADYGYELTDWY